jgi:hypothetical protein
MIGDLEDSTSLKWDYVFQVAGDVLASGGAGAAAAYLFKGYLTSLPNPITGFVCAGINIVIMRVADRIMQSMDEQYEERKQLIGLIGFGVSSVTATAITALVVGLPISLSAGLVLSGASVIGCMVFRYTYENYFREWIFGQSGMTMIETLNPPVFKKTI